MINHNAWFTSKNIIFVKLEEHGAKVHYFCTIWWSSIEKEGFIYAALKILHIIFTKEIKDRSSKCLILTISAVGKLRAPVLWEFFFFMKNFLLTREWSDMLVTDLVKWLPVLKYFRRLSSRHMNFTWRGPSFLLAGFST